MAAALDLSFTHHLHCIEDRILLEITGSYLSYKMTVLGKNGPYCKPFSWFSS